MGIIWYSNNDYMNYDIFSIVTPSNIYLQSLAVTVWHHDKMKQNDYLGADPVDNLIDRIF